ncbi:MAG: hypothetical protein HRU40_11345 [Saprospiraceae bacterium]|nr:hypothetical protein [Saprospiraceae bacterium]
MKRVEEDTQDAFENLSMLNYCSDLGNKKMNDRTIHCRSGVFHNMGAGIAVALARQWINRAR